MLLAVCVSIGALMRAIAAACFRAIIAIRAMRAAFCLMPCRYAYAPCRLLQDVAYACCQRAEDTYVYATLLRYTGGLLMLLPLPCCRYAGDNIIASRCHYADGVCLLRDVFFAAAAIRHYLRVSFHTLYYAIIDYARHFSRHLMLCLRRHAIR